MKVVILVYEGVYLLDFVGPLEIFHDTVDEQGDPAFEVCLASPDSNPIHAHTGLSFEADYDLESSPNADILVIPGGNLHLSKENPALANWIHSQVKHAQTVLSVCTGAFILADLGLLDGLQATTWFGAAQSLRQKYPEIQVLEGERYVDNGKIITTAGVSAGMDGALYTVQRLKGKAIAEKTARFVEYNWP